MNLNKEIQNLTEANFQEFLLKTQKEIFVFETENYDYYYYFPSHYKITQGCKVSTKYKLQA
jgi:hypothetical protein